MATNALLVMGVLILNPFCGQSSVVLTELTMGSWSGAYDVVGILISTHIKLGVDIANRCIAKDQYKKKRRKQA